MRMKDEDWETVLKVNLESYFRLTPRGDAGHDEAPLRAASSASPRWSA